MTREPRLEVAAKARRMGLRHADVLVEVKRGDAGPVEIGAHEFRHSLELAGARGDHDVGFASRGDRGRDGGGAARRRCAPESRLVVQHLRRDHVCLSQQGLAGLASKACVRNCRARVPAPRGSRARPHNELGFEDDPMIGRHGMEHQREKEVDSALAGRPAMCVDRSERGKGRACDHTVATDHADVARNRDGALGKPGHDALGDTVVEGERRRDPLSD